MEVTTCFALKMDSATISFCCTKLNLLRMKSNQRNKTEDEVTDFLKKNKRKRRICILT